MNQYIISYKDHHKCMSEYLELSLDEILKKYSKIHFKLDEIISVKKINADILADLIHKNKRSFFPYGFVILDHYILCEEILTHNLIDYKEEKIDFEKLNLFLKEKFGEERRIDFVNNCFIFDTISQYYDGTKLIPLHYHSGFHIIERTNKTEISSCIHRAVNTLYRMILPSGKFVYGYYAETGLGMPSYNNVRHVGALWSLCLLSSEIEYENKQEMIKKCFDSLLNYDVVYSGNKAFLLDHKRLVFDLGANALMLLALCEYYQKFHDDCYFDIMKKLADGMLSCQQPNGCFYHEYSNNLELKESNLCIFYDGETTFALLKYYEICKDEVYYQAVLHAFDYFMKHNYEQYLDHWIAYSIRELVKYHVDDEMIRFMNLNCVPSKSVVFTPTRLEAIMALYDAFCYLKKKKIENRFLDDFPINVMRDGVLFRRNSLMDYYVGEEKAIYFENEENCLYGFVGYDNCLSMRIDDIQHSVSGLYSYIQSDID